MLYLIMSYGNYQINVEKNLFQNYKKRGKHKKILREECRFLNNANCHT